MGDSSPLMVGVDYTGAGLYQLNIKTGVVTECFYAVRPKYEYESPWKVVNPLIEAGPFLTQLGVLIFLIRALFLLFNLIRLPRFLAEIVSAIILGATVVGMQDWFVLFLTPHVQTQAIETLANVGLIYYMFLVGLEMDLTTLRRIEKKVICNVAAGILFPQAAGIGLYFLILWFLDGAMIFKPLGPLFFGASLTVTSFPDLTRILSDLKILNTEVGRMALSSAFLNDLFTWIFVVVTMACLHGKGGKLSVIPTFIFLIFCWFVIRPILEWKIGRKGNSGSYSDPHIYSIFIAVLGFGLVADACGTHSMVGAFIFGIIMPKGELINLIGEKLEEFASGILLPLFFLTVGFRTNLLLIPLGFPYLVITVLLACSFKVVSTFIVAMIRGMPARESFILGVLMNTKGTLAIIILNLGIESKALHLQFYVIMVVAFMAMTVMVKPIPYLLYNPANRLKEYNQRTIENITECSEFRVLLCLHGVHNVAGMTNLLEYSNSTKQSPIEVVAAHLVELVGRATAMMIVHGNRSAGDDQDRNSDRDKDKADLMNMAMKEYGENGRVGSVQVLTVVSPFDTMHEDIYNLAEDKFSNLILIPFNKSSSSLRKLSQNVLKKPPCSVGLLLDRGLGLLRSGDEGNQQRQQLKVAMFFCGGPDGREALAYSYRMAGSQDVDLTVVRYIPCKEAENMVEDPTKFEKEQEMDDQYANEFKFRTMCDSSITYLEKVVTTGNDIMTSISNLFGHFHLCIVGRGHGVISPFLMGLSEWIEFEELGPLGDALSASIFAEHASILVLQKYEA